MANDLTNHVRHCCKCVKADRLRFCLQNKLKLFPPRGPLHYITVDIILPLPRTKNHNLHVVVITERYRKLTSPIPMRKITSGLVPAVVINNWILPYVIQDSISMENGAHFVSKFFKTVCHLMGIKRRTTTTYTPPNQRTVRTLQRNHRCTTPSIFVSKSRRLESIR